MTLILVGNKSDLEKVVDSEVVKNWCSEKNNIPFFEASAKEGSGVEDAFQVIARKAYEKKDEEVKY